jgi:hypothetical protein
MMAPLLILQSDERTCEAFVARRAHKRERLAARLNGFRLDRELARGVPPETHGALALRAQALGEPGTRRVLARAVKRVLEQARRDPSRGPLSAHLPIRRKEILAAADQLEELVARLLAPGPLRACGLAQVRLLVTQGASPLYRRHTPNAVRDAATAALDELEPAFNW